MSSVRRSLLRVALLSVALALSLWAIVPQIPIVADSPANVLERAWENARLSGQYEYRTDVVQTTLPAPALSNVGRTSTEDRYYLEGNTNLKAQTMEMLLWVEGGSVLNQSEALEIKVAGQTAMGRSNGGEWQELDNIGSVFAPGNDAMAHLAAAKNVRLTDEREIVLGNFADTYQELSFDFNGPAFADYMRDQMEAYLQSKGHLPSGITLGTAEEYRNMTGTGQLWVDSAGMPARLILDLRYPPSLNGDQLQLNIQTDFASFAPLPDTAMVVLARYGLPDSGQAWQGFLMRLGVVLGIAGLMLFLAISMSSQRIYRFFSLTIIVSMLVTPLLQGQSVLAFYDRYPAENPVQTAELAAQEAQTQAEMEALAGLNTTWDPHRDPQTAPAPIGLFQSSVGNATTLNDDGTDTDGDGLSDAREKIFKTDKNKVDSDGDGLSDGQEVLVLGLNPAKKDTDGDLIPDNVEVAGFSFGGQTWYSNPNKADSNGDGLLDSVECPDMPTCVDSDGDTIPDIFDMDNDNDGVFDGNDTSPMTVLEKFGVDDPFKLVVNNLTPQKDVFVEVQVRPTNAQNLTYAQNVLDWPTGDTSGQIRRANSNTFSNNSNGDMRLIPMLEVRVPAGEQIPFHLTAPTAVTRTFKISAEKGSIQASGSVRFTPTGNQTQLNITTDKTLTASLYAAICQDRAALSKASSSPVAQYTNQSNGATQTLNQKYLNVVNGKHALIMSYQGKTTCVNVGDLPTSTNTDQMVDVKKMQAHGISVTDINDKGDMELLVPLNIVNDSTQGQRQAFMAQVPYYLTQSAWGKAHEMRVVWLVQLLQDDGSLSVVHRYYDEWNLTGLSVREDHGLKVAVAYEATDEAISKRYLWTLATGLQQTFIMGRTEANNKNQRAVTVDSLAAAFGTNNSSDTTPALWSIPKGYIDVELSTYANRNGLGEVPTKITPNILANKFGDKTSALILVAREEQSRLVSLSGKDKNIRQGTIDMQGATLNTIAGYNWSPFKKTNNTWATYPVAEYLQTIGADAAQLFPNKTGAERTQFVNFAKSMFLLNLHGQTRVVGSNGNPVDISNIEDEEDETFGSFNDAGTNLVGLAGNLENTLNLLGGKFESLEDAGTNFFGAVNPDNELKGGAAALMLGTALTLGVLSVVYGENETVKYINEKVLPGVLAVGAVVDVVNAINDLRNVKKGLDTMADLNKASKVGAIVGLVLEATIAAAALIATWVAAGGAFPPAAAVATFAATVVTAVIMAIIAATGVGALIVAILGLIDAVLAAICAWVPGAKKALDWLCDGIAGTITNYLTRIFYSEDPVITNLTDLKERWTLSNFSNAPKDTVAGYSQGSVLDYYIDVDNKLEVKLITRPIGGTTNDLKVSPKTLQEGLDKVRESVFVYAFQPKKTDISEDLKAGTMKDSWTVNVTLNTFTQKEATAVMKTAAVRGSIRLDKVGINQKVDAYFSEGYLVPVFDCILLVCSVEMVNKTLHNDFSSEWDVFPTTLSGFYQAVAKDGGYSLAWGQGDSNPAFPRMRDFDGDGLLGSADNGPDPDDSKFDTDGDGLSDAFELQRGSNPSSTDSDSDGLSDYDEAFYGTNALRADSDADGLSDKAEIDGWELLYFDLNGNTQRTWVYANPLNADSDGDSILDSQEKTFGFNPNVVNKQQVLSYQLAATKNGQAIETPLFKAGDTLGYQATVKNELNNRFAQGLLQLTAPSALNLNATPQTFVLDPSKSSSLNQNLTLPNAASGQYEVSTVAEARIVDRRQQSNYAELYMKFDDNSFRDASGYQPPRQATCTGGSCSLNSGGISGSALASSASSYVGVNNINLTGGSFSVAAWAKRTDFHSNSHVAVAYSNFGMGYTGGGQPYCIVGSNSVVGSATVTDSEWHHLACVFDATQNRITMYRDGVSQGSTTVSPISQPDILYIGSFAAGPSNYFGGLLDEVYVYKRGLDSGAINRLYNRAALDLRLNNNTNDSAGGYQAAATQYQVSGSIRFQDKTANFGGTSGGSFRYDSNGISGQAMVADGANYVQLQGEALDVSTGKFAQSVWVKPEADLVKMEGVAANGCPAERPFRIQYFNGSDINGSPVSQECVQMSPYGFFFQWGTGSPASGVNSDNFAVRIQGKLKVNHSFDANPDFEVRHDDRLEIWINRTGDSPRRMYESNIQGRNTGADVPYKFEAGKEYDLDLRFWEYGGGAELAFTWPEWTKSYHTRGILGYNSGQSSAYPSIQHQGRKVIVGFGDGSTWQSLETGPVLNMGQWNHIVSSYDGSTYRLYVNGQEQQSRSLSATPVKQSQFWLGRSNNQANFRVDEVHAIEASGWTYDSEIEITGINRNQSPTRLAYQEDVKDDHRVRAGKNYAFTEYAMVAAYEDDGGGFAFGTDDYLKHVARSVTQPSECMEQQNPYKVDFNEGVRGTYEGRFWLGWRDYNQPPAVFCSFYNESMPFKGSIDNVQFYLSPLDGAQVEALYNAQTLHAHLRLDEPAGTGRANIAGFADSVSLARQATCNDVNACPTAGVLGLQGLAVQFSGNSNEYLKLNNIQSKAASFWFKTSSSNGLLLEVSSDTLAPPSSDGQWHHLALSHRENDDFNSDIYLDGQLLRSDDGFDLYGSVLNIGQNSFAGQIDELKLYNNRLTAEQVTAIYNAEKPAVKLHLSEATGATSFANNAPGGATFSCDSGNSACPVTGLKGQVGFSAKFDGVNDVIPLNTVSNLNMGSSWTAMGWVNLPEIKGQRPLFASTDNAFRLYVEDGTVKLLQNGTTISTKEKLKANQWNHLAVRYNASSQEATVFINGYANGNASGLSALSSGLSLVLGGAGLAGQVDEFALYPTTITDNELLSLYRAEANYVEERQTLRVTLDNDNPTVSLQSASNNHYPNSYQILAVSANDATTAISKVEAKLTGAGQSGNWADAPRCQDASNAWCPTFTPSGEGDYTLELRATDSVGNVGTLNAVTLRVDDTAPSGSITAPTANSTASLTQAGSQWQLPVAGTATDNVALASALLTLQGPNGETVSSQALNISSSPWSHNFSFDNLPTSGTYKLTLLVKDAVGKESTQTHSFTMNGSVPTQAFTNPPSQNSTLVTTTNLAGTASDTANTVNTAAVRYRPSQVGFYNQLPAGTAAVGPLPKPGLYYDFADQTASTYSGWLRTTDRSGNLAHGYCYDVSCPQTGQAGPFNGQAMRFDGQNDMIESGYEGYVPKLSGAATLAIWAQTDAQSTNKQILAQYQKNESQRENPVFALMYENKQFVCQVDGSTIRHNAPTDGKWHHLACTVSDSGTATLYLDGTAVQSQNLGKTLSSDSKPYMKVGGYELALRLGSQPDRYFKGALDEFYIYNVALTGQQVRQLYQNGSLSAVSNAAPSTPLMDAGFDQGTQNTYPLGSDQQATFYNGSAVAVAESINGIAGRGAVTVDGQNDRFDLGNTLKLADTAFSVAMWAKRDRSGQVETLFNLGNSTTANQRLSLGFLGDGRFTCDFGGNALNTTAATTDAEWHHWACTYDVTNKARVLYKDGVEVARDTSASNFVGSGSATLGALQTDSTYSQHFDGAFDDLKVYNRALSAAEVKSLALGGWQNITLSGGNWTTTPPAGLEGFYYPQVRATSNVGYVGYTSFPNFLIDTLGPRLTASSKQDVAGRTTVKVNFEDFNLKADTLTFTPACTPQTKVTNNTSPWLQKISTTPRPFGLEASCTYSGIQANVSVKVCDTSNNCTTENLTAGTRGFQRASNGISLVVLEPATLLTTTNPVSVSGLAQSNSAFQNLTASINGASIYSQNWTAGDNTLQHSWSTSWTPPAGGQYQLVVSATTWSSQSHIITETVAVDVSNPVITITTTPQSWWATSDGVLELIGQVSDDAGVSSVVVTTTNPNNQQSTSQATINDNGIWLAYVTPLSTALDGAVYTFTATATDQRGQTATQQKAIVVDVVAPSISPVEVQVEDDQFIYEAQVADVYTNATITATASFTLSDNSGVNKLWYAWTDGNLPPIEAMQSLSNPGTTPITLSVVRDAYNFLYDASGQMVYDPLSATIAVRPDPADPLFTETTTALNDIVLDGEAFYLYLRYEDIYSRTGTTLLGPYYHDTRALPNYTTLSEPAGPFEGLPIRNHIDECTLLGMDGQVANFNADYPDQQLYISWNTAGDLQLTWIGADWNTDGDLFIYFGTQPDGGSFFDWDLPAYNPYTSTMSNTIVSISPGFVEGPLKYALWIEDESTAQWLEWDANADEWVAQDLPFEYRITAEQGETFTDIIIPFEAIALDYNAPAGQFGWLDMLAFATEEDAMRLWATIPAENGVNSSLAVQLAPTAAEPSQLSLVALSLDAPKALESNAGCLFLPPDINFEMTTSLNGIGYNKTEDLLKLFLPEYNQSYLGTGQLLNTYEQWLANTYCPANPNDRACADRDLSNEELLTQLSQVREIGNRPVLPNEVISYTIAFRNDSGDALSDLFEGWNTYWAFPLSATLTGDWAGCTAVPFDIPPLSIGEVSFEAQAPASGLTQNDVLIVWGQDTEEKPGATFNCEVQIKETAVFTYLLQMRHLPDTGAPSLTLNEPRTAVNTGTVTFQGELADQLPVAAVTIEANNGTGIVSHTCPLTDTSTGAWQCDWDMTTANGGTIPSDGDTLAVRILAADSLNQIGRTDWLTLTVDTSAASLNLDEELAQLTRLSRAWNNTQPLLSAENAVINGSFNDNRTVAGVEVCDTDSGVCQAATIVSDENLAAGQTRTFTDTPASPVAIADDSCASPLERTFTVAESFTVGSVELGLAFAHSFRTDVQATLTSPAGTSVTVLNVPEPGFIANGNLRLTDAASQRVQDDFNGHRLGAPYYQNERLPNQALSAFAGEAATGTWTLSLCDQRATETGAYHRAELVLTEDVLRSDTSAVWSYRIPDATTNDDVLRNFTVYATDAVGNRTANQTFSYRVDGVAPVITATQLVTEVTMVGATTELSLTKRAMRSFLSDYPLMFNGTVSDGGTVAEVFASVTTPFGETAAYPATLAGEAWSWTFQPPYPGQYTIFINAADEAGNVNAVGSYSLNVLPAPQTPLLTYTLSVSTTGQGFVTPPSGLYNEGQTLELSAIADEGWGFIGWTGDVVSDTNPLSVLMDGDKQVMAHFTETRFITYTLDLTIVGAGTVNVVPNQSVFTSGTVITLTAVPDEGNSFLHWSQVFTSTPVMTSTNPITLTMNQDEAVTATFSGADRPTIYLPIVLK